MDVKRNLTSELASIVKTAVRENRAEHVDVLPNDILNSVCNVIEAVFIHGLKESRGASFKSSRKSKMGKWSYPEPNFWPFLEKFTHRNIRAQIGNLNQIKTDIGRARAWIRICLNDRVLENYLSAMLREQQIIRHFYNQRAYLRDSEQCDLMLNYTRALGKLTFKAPLNSSILNEWTPTPLKLAGVLTEKRTSTRSSRSVVDMEDVLEDDENNDVAVAVSALEYDGLDDPAFSDISDMHSESQFSIQSRPVAAYGDKRLLFSPDGDSQSGSDFHDSVGSFGGTTQKQGASFMGTLGESRTTMTTVEEERQKLDAVLLSFNNARTTNEDEKNPFVDSGVAASPPTSTNVDTITKEEMEKKPCQVETEVNTDITFDEKNTSHMREEDAGTCQKDEAHAEKEHSEPKEIMSDDMKQFGLNDQLEMSFSPGNSLAGRGWSSPNFEPDRRASSPAVSSVKSGDRQLSSSVGNSSGGGFAALFSALMSNSNVPLRNNGEEDANGGTRDGGDIESTLNGDKENEVHVETSELVNGTNGNDNVANDNGNVETLPTNNARISSSSSSSLENFVVVEESQESLDQAAAQKSFRLSLLTKIADDVGLDTQGFKCYSCQRTIGLPLFGTYRFCTYDGHYYCVECHLNEEKIIPARVIMNWDLKPKPVSRASKAFLDLIADQPLIDIQKANTTLYDVSKGLNEAKLLRLQLSYVAMYLLSCKESVAEDLRKRVWPKEYLYSAVDQYSITDFMEVNSGQLQKHLKSVIQYATKHVLQQCRLCAQKGFICELCNDPKIIYAFQLDLTHRCSKCHAVYHAKCFNDQKNTTCPKCARRELYMQQAERSSLNLENMLPLAV